MELEEKIAEYRARKRRGLLVKKVQNSVKDVFSWLHDKVETTMNDQDDVSFFLHNIIIFLIFTVTDETYLLTTSAL